MKSPRRAGMILVTTLWLLVGLILIGNYLAMGLEEVQDMALRRQDETRARIAIHDTTATLVYLLATHRMTRAGLDVPPAGDDDYQIARDLGLVDEYGNLNPRPLGTELQLHDRVYLGLDGTEFAIQDENGLLQLSWVQPQSFQRMLRALGIPEAHWDRLRDRLYDYMDPDDFHRVNGAEAKHYREAGLPPPANRSLLTPGEVAKILGWRDFPEIPKNPAWRTQISVFTSGNPYFGTASPETMQWITGVAPAVAESIAQGFSQYDYQGLSSLYRLLLELGTSPENFTAFPSARQRVTVWHSDLGGVAQVHLHLTPLLGRPWEAEYVLPTPRFDRYQQPPTRLEIPLLASGD